MKSNFFLLLTFLLTFVACKDNSIKVSGKLDSPSGNGYLFLEELKGASLETIDSLRIEQDGQFEFSVESDLPTFLLLKSDNSNFLTLLAYPGDRIRVIGSWGTMGEPESLSGSEDTQKMLDYNKALKNTIAKLNGLNEIYMQNEDNPNLKDIINTLDSTAQAYLKEISDYTKNYIDKNLHSPISLIALYQQVAPQAYVLNPVDDIDYFVKVDSSLFSLYPESNPIKELHENVQALVRSVGNIKGGPVSADSGDQAPEIALPSPGGEIIKLSSTRGQVVLLDFWAAWCNPCRRENPNLVKAYNLYKTKGFQIYQVSLDKTREDWLNGIEADKLNQWIHVSDLKYWNSVVVPLYKINAIPYNLLLNKEGKVIARNLRGDSLLSKLEEVFK